MPTTLLVTIKGNGLIPLIGKRAPLVNKTPISEEDYNILKSMGWDIKVHSAANPRVNVNELNGAAPVVPAKAPEKKDEKVEDEKTSETTDETQTEAAPSQSDETQTEAVTDSQEEETVTLPNGITYDEENSVYRDSEGNAVEVDEEYNVTGYIDEDGNVTPVEEQGEEASEEQTEEATEEQGEEASEEAAPAEVATPKSRKSRK